MPARSEAIGFALPRRPPPELLYQIPHWYACHTHSRHEKKVDALLGRQRIESYLPTHERESRWKDRRKIIRVPLFPGYVFGRFTLGQLASVLCTHGVAGVVGVRGYPTPIPDGEIESVRVLSLAAADLAAPPEPAALLERGDRVRVSAGPFMGIEGLVVERRGRRRFLVGISAIGQGLEIDISGADLVPVA